MLPNGRQPFFAQLPGAMAAALSWSVFSYGFSIYLTYAPQGMSAIYGSLTTAVIIMLWLYFCMWLLFLGAEINDYLQRPENFALTDDTNMIE
jgi:membrane protein